MTTNRTTLISFLKKNRNEKKLGITFIGSRSKKDDCFISYFELYQSVCARLGFLQDQGLKPKDELLFQVTSNKDFIYFFWASLLGGIVPIPVSLGENKEKKLKVLRILGKLKKPWLLVDHLTKKDFDTEKIKKVLIKKEEDFNFDCTPYESSENEVAYVQFSSGSTGDPKGVVLTHENVVTNIRDMIEGCAANKNDRCLTWMPLTHDMGLVGGHMINVVLGINHYIMNTSLFIRRPFLWLQRAFEYNVTVLISPNFGYRHFLNYANFDEMKKLGIDLSHIRIIMNGAEMISTRLAHEFIMKLVPYGLKETAFFMVYGLAEAVLGVTFPPVSKVFKQVTLGRKHLIVGELIKEVQDTEEGISFVSCGRPLRNCDLKITNDVGKILIDEKVGHILIKGKNVTSRYYGDEKATEQTIDFEGWLRTGDLGFMKEGDLFVTGRSKDTIISNGVNYYSHDLERIISDITKIDLRHLVVCSIQTTRIEKERVVAFIGIKGIKENSEKISSYLKKEVFKIIGLRIEDIVFVKSIPRTTSGKVQRYKLKEDYCHEQLQ